MRFIYIKIYISIFSLFLCTRLQAQELQQIKNFGKNKGHLKMYAHIPLGVEGNKAIALVVVLHGCTQCAESVASLTGWNKLADEYNFYVLYPQQRVINNLERCFKWYKKKHINKESGENSSIKQMIEYMKKRYIIDTNKIYITGLSAGAAMSVVMMADYPSLFHSGAIFAGVPYKVATNLFTYPMVFFGKRIKSPEKWAEYVRKQNPSYLGKYPNIIIYQGNNDRIVHKQNAIELMKQWTNLHGLSTTPNEIIPSYTGISDIERSAYKTKLGVESVVFYKINNLGHALLIDTGHCSCQGGKKGVFSENKKYFSTLFTAYDFNLIEAPKIEGKKEVNRWEKSLSYQVTWHEKSTYEWVLPTDCKEVKHTQSNVVYLNWGKTSGCINVTETDSIGCQKKYPTLFVRVLD
ncbi:MAG: PHB depolymerase family esterase [Bacteroidetes bacterium]|nr:PHB depolymerase family esterase [Bacteroidota bacterium]